MKRCVDVRYLLYPPPDYDKSAHEWPMIVFLHGAGECGDDLDRVKRHGPPKLIARGDILPFIVFAPQCPQGVHWNASWLSPLLDEVCRRVRVDQDRIYLTGISTGGFGTWHWAVSEPHRFAAIVPICGGGDPQEIHRIKHLPVWAFHGALDEIIPLEESTVTVEALKACGGNVRLTIYPEVEHDSWTATYDNPDLYAWLLAHCRVAPAAPRV